MGRGACAARDGGPAKLASRAAGAVRPGEWWWSVQRPGGAAATGKWAWSGDTAQAMSERWADNGSTRQRRDGAKSRIRGPFIRQTPSD
jgi:hypothetical protein